MLTELMQIVSVDPGENEQLLLLGGKVIAAVNNELRKIYRLDSGPIINIHQLPVKYQLYEIDERQCEGFRLIFYGGQRLQTLN